MGTRELRAAFGCDTTDVGGDMFSEGDLEVEAKILFGPCTWGRGVEAVTEVVGSIGTPIGVGAVEEAFETFLGVM